MGRKTWLLIAKFMFYSLVFGQDLDKLLQKYDEITKLYNQTKQESEGHIITFTREDIKRYQIYTLSDVLQVIKYFILQKNQFGEKVLAYATIYPFENSTIRLFINDHEVSAVFKKTGLPMWADLPMDFIEHVEVYQGESAVKFNNEAAGTIIKIYTKKPERENSGLVRITNSTRKDYSLNFYLGRETENNSAYSFFLNKTFYQSKKYKNDNETLRNRYSDVYGYIQFKTKQWNFESGFVSKKGNLFRGSSVYGVPFSDYSGSHGYISTSFKPSREIDLELRFYADKISNNYIQLGNFLNPIIAVNPVETVIYWDKEIDSYKIGSDFMYDTRIYSHFISIGGKLQKSGYKLRDVRTSRQIKDENFENYHSFFVEDVFNVLPNVGIIGGIKYENIERGYGPDIDSFLWRIGLITIFKKYRYLKIFISKYYTPPYFVEVFTNKNLTKQKNRSITFELSEINTLGHFIFTGGYIKVSNTITINPFEFTYFNNDQTLKYKFYSFDYIKKIENLELKVNYFSVIVDKKEFETAPSKGGFAEISYFRKRFSGFVQLIYRNSYKFINSRIDEGYNLNAGVRIAVSENNSLEFKGVNLLAKGIKTPAFSNPDFRYFLEDRRILFTFVREF